MECTVKGKICDSTKKTIQGILIKIYLHKLFDNHHLLGSTVTDVAGNFEYTFNISHHDPFNSDDLPQIFIEIIDLNRRFESVIDQNISNLAYFERTDEHGNLVWTGPVAKNINDIQKYDIIITFSPRPLPKSCDSIVIGSGFGGTVAALTLANKIQNDANKDPNMKNARVILLERGQWWISHEIPDDGTTGTINGKPTMRQFLEEKGMPFSFWAHPDNLRGIMKLLGSSRTMNLKGVYDFRVLQNVYVIAGSGVGGGSLVYSNVTEKPDNIVFKNWPTNTDDFENLDNFFRDAEKFIGVNKITTTAGLGNFKLARTKVFQEAAKKINSNKNNIINTFPYDANLSITDIPQSVFTSGHPTQDEMNKYSKQQNVCQRQGRCVLGCIPGARHTMNKKIYDAISSSTPKPLDVFPLIEVDHIETIEGEDYQYNVFYKDHSIGNDSSEPQLQSIKTHRVVLSAGTLNTTEILLRSKKFNLKLSKTLGNKFSTNADLLGVVNQTTETIDASRGPIVTSITAFKDKSGNFAYSIEDSGIPKMFADLFATMFDLMAATNINNNPKFLNTIEKNIGEVFHKYFTGPSILMTDPIGMFSKYILNNEKLMVALRNMLNGQNLMESPIVDTVLKEMQELISDKNKPLVSPEERVNNILLLSGMGIDKDPKATLVLQDDKLTLDKKYNLDQQVFKDIIETMREFAGLTGKNGEKSFIVPLWDEANPANSKQFVLHPLGGCSMGKDATEGVVNSYGQVFKGETGNDTYEDLYIMDGSIIPGAIGVNPSMTITALTLRIAAKNFGATNIPTRVPGA